ncbi:hypothetical protein AMTRI_Chr03g139890 [Amborella trichopoda]|uniref:Uncharacterized protein n=1 Tax=Amborella trichopoda TaxID=13333 RepID=W1P1R1_AMBTC|nr:hypothetical protein AMTR_s00103p00139710 [Amborella trichopoda]
MAPAGARRRTQYKRLLMVESKKKEAPLKARPPKHPQRRRDEQREEERESGEHDREVEREDGCTTPRAEEFRIPELLSCPPAPKKRRLPSSRASTALPFFYPPDLELFFFSLHNISV